MFYKDDVPNVEVGVEISGSFAPVGRIVTSALPAGRVVMTTHRGSWDVGPAHQAVIDECDRLGLERVGPRWEIYGHFNAPATKRSRSTTSCGEGRRETPHARGLPWAARPAIGLGYEPAT